MDRAGDPVKIVVVHPDGNTDTYKPVHGHWIVDDNGTLHVRDGNHRKQASYANGSWSRVSWESS